MTLPTTRRARLLTVVAWLLGATTMMGCGSSGDGGAADLADLAVSTGDGAGPGVVDLAAPPGIDSGPSGPSVSAMIGPAGGTLSHPDGAQLVVPPGALGEPVQIRITRLPTPPDAKMVQRSKFAGPLFDFAPDGLSFKVPAFITLPYDPGATTADEVFPGVKSKDDGVFYLGGRDGDESESFTVDEVAHSVTTPVDHFCNWAALTSNWSATVRAAVATDVPVPSGHTPNTPGMGVLRVHQLQGLNADDRFAARNHADVKYIIIHTTGDQCGRGNCAGGAPCPGNGTCNAAGQCVPHGCFVGTCAGATGPVRWAMVVNNKGAEATPTDCNPNKTMCDCSTANGFIAHFYVTRSGAIYQVANLEGPNSAPLHATNKPVSLASVGIEIIHGGDGQPGSYEEAGYPGAQMAAVARLTEYLIRYFAIPRRVGNIMDHVVEAQDVVQGISIYAHKEVNTKAFDDPKRHHDPPDSFPWEVLLHALAGFNTGTIQTRGGSALAGGAGGDGARIDFNTTDQAIAPMACGVKVVSDMLVSGNYEDLTIRPANVAGVTLTADTTITASGSVYLDTGNVIKTQGHKLTIDARGLVVINGDILALGNDGTMQAPNGVPGSTVKIVSAAGGPMLIPSLDSRGGHSYDRTDVSGGAGGMVNIISSIDGPDAQKATIMLRGSNNLILQLPASGAGGKNELTWGAPAGIGSNAGITTSGGMGGSAGFAGMAGSAGGRGGSVLVDADGGIIEPSTFTIRTGADTGQAATNSDYLGRLNNARFSFLEFPLGGTGGRGGVTYAMATPGNGGVGGQAGDITIVGPLADTIPPMTERNTKVYRLNGQQGSGSAQPEAWIITTHDSKGANLLRLSAAGGSGGPSGAYSANASYGFFGKAGAHGTITLNGTPTPAGM